MGLCRSILMPAINTNGHWYDQKEISHLSYCELMELRQMAEKATPGPWWFNGRDIKLAYEYKNNRIEGIYGNLIVSSLYVPNCLVYRSRGEEQRNGNFIACSHPEVVKYLVDEVLSLRSELAERVRKG